MTEILSPAGGPEALTAAVRAGADAVYFGASSFNARRNAKNFRDSDISEAAAYCRVRGVKTYLTLNTLISDGERTAALETAMKAYDAGIDALIVQDIGLARLLRDNLPQMPLHASTQMSVLSAEALPALKELGFSRVVAGREMDRPSLAKLCEEAKRLGMEIEVFVHGALCMCVSGQCYLSSMLGGRSGNRGLCAQACRLPFGVPGGTGYDLSLKDMSYSGHIAELRDMGVLSFKIEGRMKRPEYVAAATACMRAAADGKEIPEDAAKVLGSIFSRSGHTDGYFTGKTGKDMFGIRTPADEQLSAQTVNVTHELYRKERQSVPVDMTVEIHKNENVKLTVSDQKNTVSVSGDIPDTAERSPISAESVTEKLSKLGGTVFTAGKVSAIVDGGLYFGAAPLGELRRRATEELEKKRAEFTAVPHISADEVKLSPTAAPTEKRHKIYASFRSPDQIPENLDGIDAVILPAECDFSKVAVGGAELIADIPRGVMHGTDKLNDALKKAAECGVKRAVCNDLAAMTFAKETGLGIIAGFGMNIYNTESMLTAEMLGAKAAVVSFEADISLSARFGGNTEKGIISYGRLPLMLVRNCPGKNGAGCKTCRGHCHLTDRMGVKFPVMCRGEFSEVFNSRPLWMFDKKHELLLFDFEVLYFTDEPREECRAVLTAAKNGLKPSSLYTRGLYYREVL